MTNFQRIPDSNEEKDKQLWELAKRRAGFKGHLLSYFLVNSFLWVIWLLTGARTSGNGIPWPVWPMFGWGIGIISHYLSAYVYPGMNSVEKEYEKLKNQQKS